MNLSSLQFLRRGGEKSLDSAARSVVEALVFDSCAFPSVQSPASTRSSRHYSKHLPASPLLCCHHAQPLLHTITLSISQIGSQPWNYSRVCGLQSRPSETTPSVTLNASLAIAQGWTYTRANRLVVSITSNTHEQPMQTEWHLTKI